MAQQSAIITGAAKRVGRSLAIGLAERGFDIALHYQRSGQEARDTAEEIRKFGRQCILLSCDLTDEKEMRPGEKGSRKTWQYSAFDQQCFDL